MTLTWMRIIALLGLAIASVSPAMAQQRTEIWDIALGSDVSEIAPGCVEYACGTNGGPPSRRLAGFADFATCRPEANGLHEVYFRYDDTQEFVARALEQGRDVMRFGGTVAYDFPVMVSLLIDDAGIVQGKRIITDARPAYRTARAHYEFWTLGNLLRNQFGADWSCTDLDAAEGERPVGTYLIKRECRLDGAEGSLSIQQRYLQKPGQVFVDPQNQHFQPEAFESTTRFEQLASGIAG